MRVETRSRSVVEAVGIVLRRMPSEARKKVEEFVTVVRADRDFHMLGLGGIDPTSAMLAPTWKSLSDIGSTNYNAQIVVTLPIFKLSSAKSQIGIVAHEFGHAWRASQFGKGWHEYMQTRHAAEERLADDWSQRWGFEDNIKIMRDERRRIVNPLLEEQEPVIMRRILDQARRQQEKMRSLIANENNP